MKPLIHEVYETNINPNTFAMAFLNADSEQQAAVLIDMSVSYEISRLEAQMAYARDDMDDNERKKICEMLRMMAEMIETE
jgi:hypothetical protein